MRLATPVADLRSPVFQHLHGNCFGLFTSDIQIERAKSISMKELKQSLTRKVTKASPKI